MVYSGVLLSVDSSTFSRERFLGWYDRMNRVEGRSSWHCWRTKNKSGGSNTIKQYRRVWLIMVPVIFQKNLSVLDWLVWQDPNHSKSRCLFVFVYDLLGRRLYNISVLVLSLSLLPNLLVDDICVPTPSVNDVCRSFVFVEIRLFPSDSTYTGLRDLQFFFYSFYLFRPYTSTVSLLLPKPSSPLVFFELSLSLLKDFSCPFIFQSSFLCPSVGVTLVNLTEGAPLWPLSQPFLVPDYLSSDLII